MPSSFSADLNKFVLKLERGSRAVFTGAVEEVHRSVTVGSPLTGAPGQPVDTGFLLNSWVLRYTSRTTAETSTHASYAPVIEYKLPSAYDPSGQDRPPREPGRRHRKSTIGGNRSVALTVGGWQNIVDHVARKVWV
jgi:hypothetical protein